MPEVNADKSRRIAMRQAVRQIARVAAIMYYWMFFNVFWGTLVLLHVPRGKATVAWFAAVGFFACFSVMMFRQHTDGPSTDKRKIINQLYVATASFIAVLGWGCVLFVTRNRWDFADFSRRLVALSFLVVVLFLHGWLFRRRFPY